MSTILVTRHPGAIQWIHDSGIKVDSHRDHLDTNEINKGDVVIGILPVNLAAEVCARGGQYLHICMELPRVARGKELSSDQMAEFNATLQPFTVSRQEDCHANFGA